MIELSNLYCAINLWNRKYLPQCNYLLDFMSYINTICCYDTDFILSVTIVYTHESTSSISSYLLAWLVRFKTWSLHGSLHTSCWVIPMSLIQRSSTCSFYFQIWFFWDSFWDTLTYLSVRIDREVYDIVVKMQQNVWKIVKRQL